MSRLQKAWTRLGRPEAIGWPVGVVFFPQVFFGSYAATFVDVSGRLLEFTGARVVSILAMVAILLLGRSALNTFATATPQPLITLGTLIATVITGSTVQNAMLIALDFTDRWNIGQRVLLSGPGLFTLLVLACLVVASARESARTNSELADVARQLADTKGRTEDLALEKRHQLMESVRAEIDQALATLSSRKRGTLKDDLNALLDDVVRPLSYRLANDVTGGSAPTRLPTSPRIVWSDAFRGALQTNPAHPTVTTVWLGILVGVYLIISLGGPGIYAAIIAGAIAWVALFLVRAFWSSTARLSLTAQGVVYSAIIASYSSGSAVLITEVSGYNLLLPHSFIGFVLLSLSMAWTISLIYGLTHQLDSTQAELEHYVDELQRDIIAINTDVRALQHRLSRALHGPVQSALLSLIQRVTQQDADNTGLPALNDFTRELTNMLDGAQEGTDREGFNLSAAVAELVEFWDDVTTIDVHLDPLPTNSAPAGQECERVLLELIREGCGNAIKHGAATTITINTEVDVETDTINLVIDNNGRPLHTDPIQGMGSRIFDESCLSWSRSQHGSTVRLHATIPLCR